MKPHPLMKLRIVIGWIVEEDCCSFSLPPRLSTGFPSGTDIYCCFSAKWLPAPQANVEVCCVEFGPLPASQDCSREQWVCCRYSVAEVLLVMRRLKLEAQCGSISHTWHMRERKKRLTWTWRVGFHKVPCRAPNCSDWTSTGFVSYTIFIYSLQDSKHV